MLHKLFCEEHRFPRMYDSRLISGWGRREIWTCNDCLATKVIIETDQPDGSVSRVEQVIEPVARQEK